MDIKNIDLGDLISDAVQEGPGGEKFEFVRKLMALAAMLKDNGLTPETAAESADGAMFSQHMNYKVEKGEVKEEEAFEAINDRRASSFLTESRALIASAVVRGCESLGWALGSLVHAPAIGASIGLAVGNFLNEPIGKIVDAGAKRMLSVAVKARRKVDNFIEDAGRTLNRWADKISDWLSA